MPRRPPTGRGDRPGDGGRAQLKRYTFIYLNRTTGGRLVLRPGSTVRTPVGLRVLGKKFTAPVVRNATAGTLVTLTTRFTPRNFPKKAKDLVLRVVHRHPDGTLTEARLGADGRIIG